MKQNLEIRVIPTSFSTPEFFNLEIHTSTPNTEDVERVYVDDNPAPSVPQELPRTLRSAPTQLTIIGFLMFLGPGMFCAMNGLGGGGLQNPHPANVANVAVYATFAVVGFVSGPIVTQIGYRTSFIVGGIGYGLYSSSLLSYKLHGDEKFLISAGILLGVFSSLLWTSQGAMLISYSSPQTRGRYISLVWGLFNLGAGIGSMLVFVLSINSKASGISVSMFALFISLMFSCALGALFICGREKVLLNGASLVCVESASWTGAFKGFTHRLRTHSRIFALFPMFFVSNYYYPYLFNDMNLRTFNIRTRALNNSLFWLMEIPGSYAMGLLLDQNGLSRPARARFGFVFVLLLTITIWAGDYIWQRAHNSSVTSASSLAPLDFHDSEYVGPVIIFLSFGFFDAVWQSFILWLIGAIDDDSEIAAEFAGFYKGLQAAGAAVAYRTNMLDGKSLSDMVISWSMLLLSLAIAGPMIFFKIRK